MGAQPIDSVGYLYSVDAVKVPVDPIDLLEASSVEADLVLAGRRMKMSIFISNFKVM